MSKTIDVLASAHNDIRGIFGRTNGQKKRNT